MSAFQVNRYSKLAILTRSYPLSHKPNLLVIDIAGLTPKKCPILDRLPNGHDIAVTHGTGNDENVEMIFFISPATLAPTDMDQLQVDVDEFRTQYNASTHAYPLSNPVANVLENHLSYADAERHAGLVTQATFDPDRYDLYVRVSGGMPFPMIEVTERKDYDTIDTNSIIQLGNSGVELNLPIRTVVPVINPKRLRVFVMNFSVIHRPIMLELRHVISLVQDHMSKMATELTTADLIASRDLSTSLTYDKT